MPNIYLYRILTYHFPKSVEAFRQLLQPWLGLVLLGGRWMHTVTGDCTQHAKIRGGGEVTGFFFLPLWLVTVHDGHIHYPSCTMCAAAAAVSSCSSSLGYWSHSTNIIQYSTYSTVLDSCTVYSIENEAFSRGRGEASSRKEDSLTLLFEPGMVRYEPFVIFKSSKLSS